MNTYRIYKMLRNDFVEVWRIETDHAYLLYVKRRPSLRHWSEDNKGKAPLSQLRDIKNFNTQFRDERGFAEEFEAESDKEALEKVFVDIL